ncbi:MAG: GNAT family N-acetyltransferase [Planctomycetaceae bacterium]
MISYRCFHNSDPPQIAALWESSGLGQGAASGVTVDAFEFFVFAQSFFDKNGLIVAVEDNQIVGFVHATRAVNEEQTGLSDTSGSIVALLVHPDSRNAGIGSELLKRGVGYLAALGVGSVELGPTEVTNGFYVGLYGGSEPCGFRDSDGPFAEFFGKRGWEPAKTYLSYQKDLAAGSRDPVNVKLITNRRKTQLEPSDPKNDASWWWMTRFGRMDCVKFSLLEKSSREPLASCKIFGLDSFIPKWGQRAAGLGQVCVSDEHSEKAYDLSLLLEMSKYLREQLITLIDACVDEAAAGEIKLLESAGFKQCDRGTVFRMSEEAQAAYAQQVQQSADGPAA